MNDAELAAAIHELRWCADMLDGNRRAVIDCRIERYLERLSPEWRRCFDARGKWIKK